MAKKIIVLDTNSSDGGFISIRAALWFPLANPIVQPPSTDSAWPGRSQAEVDALRSGVVREEVRHFVFAVGTSTAVMKAALEADWSARAAFLATQPPPGQFFGVFFDSATGWSA